MNTRDLLRIDVGSELRTLCEAQLRGTWQVPAEIVRFALRSGAGGCSVTWRYGVFSFRWQGGVGGEGVLRQLQAALDHDRDPAIRQQSIAGLESAGAEGLLWAAGLRGARLQVEASGVRFSHRDGRRPLLERCARPEIRDSVTIRWSCSRLDRRRAVSWLRLATRFVDAALLLDGEEPPRSFSGGLFHIRQDRPVPSRIGLTRTGNEPLLWLLQDGVVSARAAIPGYPPFEAAVELGGVVGPGASGAGLRRAVRPYLKDIVDRAVWIMIQVAERLDEVGEREQQRLLTLLLRAARCGMNEHEIRGLSLFRTAGRGAQRLSLNQVEALARHRDGRLFAVDSGEDATPGLVDGSSTVVASREARSLISDLTSVRFLPPPRRYEPGIRMVSRWARRSVSRVMRRLRCIHGTRPLPDTMLEAEEVRMLSLLRPLAAPTQVFLGPGAGEACRPKGLLVLPKDNPAVVAAVQLAEKDPSWLYPMLLALEICDLPHQTLRNRWRNRAKSLVRDN